MFTEISTSYSSVKVALDPTPSQIRSLFNHAGMARYVYNYLLSYVVEENKQNHSVSTSFYALRKHWNQVKADVAPWWYECSKEAAAFGCECLAKAFTNYFEGRKTGRNVGVPQFKSKTRSKPAFAYTTGSFGTVQNDPYGLKLPRIGRIHTFENVH